MDYRDVNGHLANHKQPLSGELKQGSFKCSLCAQQYDSVLSYQCQKAGLHGEKCSYCVDEACYNGFERIIIRPFHRHHLQLARSRPQIQQKCSLCQIEDPSFSSFYECKRCDYTVHLQCAIPTAVSNRLESRRHTINIDFHAHPLNLFTSLDDLKLQEVCSVCLKPHSGPSYGCIECFIFFHDECATKIPHQISYTPFRFLSTNPLIARLASAHVKCAFCSLKFRGLCYETPTLRLPHHVGSFKCHLKCATLNCHSVGLYDKRAHNHYLKYIVLGADSNIKCSGCGQKCIDSFYRCYICCINLHFECIPLPRAVKTTYHRHALTFKDHFANDCYQEHFCDLCETKRNPDHAVYFCEECEYVVHINCVAEEGLQRKHSVEVLENMIPREKRFGETKNGDGDDSKLELTDEFQKEKDA